MGSNVLNAANMAMCVRDLRYSVFCLLCITAQICLTMKLYHDILKD